MIINLAKGSNQVLDIVDYLEALHKGPMVISPQSLVEFWNNYYGNTFEEVEKVKKAFSNLENAVKKIDSSYDELSVGINELIGKFKDNYGYVIDDNMRSKISSLLNKIHGSFISESLPRQLLDPIATMRKMHNFPPGFKDSGNGDFYIWADILYCVKLLEVLNDNSPDNSINAPILFITNDVKIDWSSDGIIHPALSSELSYVSSKKIQPVTVAQFFDIMKSNEWN